LALDGGEWLTGHPSWFTPGDRTGHCPLTSRVGGPGGRTGSSDDEELLLYFYQSLEGKIDGCSLFPTF